MSTRMREKSRAGSPNHEKHDNGEINGKVHRGEIEGHHGICGMIGGFARRNNVDAHVQGDVRQTSGTRLQA